MTHTECVCGDCDLQVEITCSQKANTVKQDPMQALRFHLTALVCSDKGFDSWSGLSDVKFTRELYVAVARLQKERNEAVETLERVRAALAPQDTGFYSATDE